MTSDWVEVVLLEVVGDSPAELRSLPVGGAEVDARPDSRIDDFPERVGEPLKAARSAGFVAEGAEGDLIGAEEVLERVDKRTSRTGVARGMFGEGRGEEREQRVADWCRAVK